MFFKNGFYLVVKFSFYLVILVLIDEFLFVIWCKVELLCYMGSFVFIKFSKFILELLNA